MVEQQHQLNRHEFEQAPGDSDGQGSLASCSPWGRKESDMPERLKNTTDLHVRTLGLHSHGHEDGPQFNRGSFL